MLGVELEPRNCPRLFVIASGAVHSLARTRASRMRPTGPELLLAMCERLSAVSEDDSDVISTRCLKKMGLAVSGLECPGYHLFGALDRQLANVGVPFVHSLERTARNDLSSEFKWSLALVKW